MKNRFTLPLLASSVIVLGTTAALAAPIPLGITTTTAYTSGAMVTSTSGQTQAPPNFGDPTPFTVSYTETIFRGGSGAMCATCLDFVFNFSNVATTGTDPILEFTIASFPNANISANYVQNNGVAPDQAIMTGNGVLNFDFDGGNPGVLPGQRADTLVVFTAQTGYQAGGLTFQDGTTANDPGLVPSANPTTAVTPEPSSLVLLGTGLVSVAGFARRKFHS